MIGEPTPQAGSDASDKNEYEKNAARLAEIGNKNLGEVSDDDLEAILAERKALKSAQTENIGKAEDEAIAEDMARDAEKARQAAEAKQAEEAARAEQAAAHQAKEAEDAAKAATLAEQIKSGAVGVSNTEAVGSMDRGEGSLYKKLVAAFHARNQGQFDSEKEQAWENLSAELLPQLQDISDLKEASFYLSESNRHIAEKKWDELSAEEVERAATPEEIEVAADNFRIGQYGDLINKASRKYSDLTGKDLRMVMRAKAMDEGR